MFVSLEIPNGKGISLFLRNLADDTDQFDQFDSMAADWDSERDRGRRALTGINMLLGAERSSAFPMMFFQYNWQGTLGVEYWSRDFALVFKHAFAVARSLQVELHVDVDVGDIMEKVAADNGWKIELDEATLLQGGEGADRINAEIANGGRWLLQISSGFERLPVLCADCFMSPVEASGGFCSPCAKAHHN